MKKQQASLTAKALQDNHENSTPDSIGTDYESKNDTSLSEGEGVELKAPVLKEDASLLCSLEEGKLGSPVPVNDLAKAKVHLEPQLMLLGSDELKKYTEW